MTDEGQEAAYLFHLRVFITYLKTRVMLGVREGKREEEVGREGREECEK